MKWVRRLNRGSIGTDFVLWLIRLAFVIAVTFLIVFAVSSYNNRDVDIRAIEGDVIINRLFYSDDCLAYSDVRIHVGTVDLKKFDNFRLKNCLKGDYYIKAELKDIGKTAYNDEDLFEQNAGFCKFKNKFYCYDKEIYAIVYDNGVLKNDMLKMRLVLPLKAYEEYSTGLGGMSNE